MKYKSRRNFTKKLVLSITSLSLVGLIFVYVIVNTMFRTIIYDNVIGATHSEVKLISQEIDHWFEIGNHIVANLSRLWTSLGVDFIEPVANSLLDETDFISEVLTGFSDGSFIGGTYWVPDEDWVSTTRPWYIAAKQGGGEIVTTVPYLSSINNHGIVTSIAKWVPDLGGMEAVVGIVISLDEIISMVNEYRLKDGGYLMLIGPKGEIISHPRAEFIIGAFGDESIVFLEDIPNGKFFMENIHGGNGLFEFDDDILGQSYFMTFDLEATGWNLAVIIPAAAVLAPVSQYLLVIMLTSGAVIVALLLLTMFFMSLLTRNMEDTKFSEERLRIIIDNMPLVSNLRDRDFNIIDCNEEARRLFGLSSKEEYLRRFFELSPELQPDGRSSDEKARELINEAFEKGHIVFEWMHQKPNGEPIPTEVSLSRVEWRGNESLIAFVRDLRDFYKYKEAETYARQRLETMLDSSPLLVTIFNEESEVLEANQVAERLFEIPDKQMYIDDYFAFSPELQPNGISSKQYAKDMLDIAIEHGRSRFDWLYKTSKGEEIPCEETIMSVKLNNERMLIAYTRDLREINKAAQMVSKLEKAAFTDALTGAYNRRYFLETAEKELAKAIINVEDLSLIMIDVDRFKNINDTYGHPVGDEVLKILVSRINGALRKGTVVARYGGEEFFVLLPGSNAQTALNTAERIRQRVGDEHFRTKDIDVPVTISLGTASKPEKGVALEALIGNADKALYHAKNSGRNRTVQF